MLGDEEDENGANKLGFSFAGSGFRGGAVKVEVFERMMGRTERGWS